MGFRVQAGLALRHARAGPLVGHQPMERGAIRRRPINWRERHPLIRGSGCLLLLGGWPQTWPTRRPGRRVSASERDLRLEAVALGTETADRLHRLRPARFAGSWLIGFPSTPEGRSVNLRSWFGRGFHLRNSLPSPA